MQAELQSKKKLKENENDFFCVEDEANIRELVVYTLETTGFETVDLKKAHHSLKLWQRNCQS